MIRERIVNGPLTQKMCKCTCKTVCTETAFLGPGANFGVWDIHADVTNEHLDFLREHKCCTWVFRLTSKDLIGFEAPFIAAAVVCAHACILYI